MSHQPLARVQVLALALLTGCRTGPGTTKAADTGAQDPGDTVDADGDGFTAAEDCDDSDAAVFPGADEICDDGVVNDCDNDTAADWCARFVSTSDAIAIWEIFYLGRDYYRMAGAGDLNGDGRDDIVLGHPHLDLLSVDPWSYEWELEAYAVGGVYVYYGTTRGHHASGQEDRSIEGAVEGAYLGWDLLGMGDADGDGYDDLAVGAGNSAFDGPAVYRVDGPAAIESMSEATALATHGEDNECAGTSLATVADQDGDGAPELLVGDRCAGRVHLVSGGASEPGVLGVDDLATFYASGRDSMFGHAMAGGDFDGDGQEDIAIGATEYPATARSDSLGYVVVYDGPVTGSSSDSDLSDSDADSTVRAVPDDTIVSSSGRYNMLLGNAVAASDLDGDGYDDLAVGAPIRNDDTVVDPYGSDQEGGLYVYLGPLSGELGVPDADFSLTGDEDNLTVGGETTADQDLNGDGHPDLLVGVGRIEWKAPSLGTSYASTRAWVVYGPISTGNRLASDADVIIDDDVGVTDWGFGLQTRVAGDTNADGQVELLIGDVGEWFGLFDLPSGDD